MKLSEIKKTPIDIKIHKLMTNIILPYIFDGGISNEELTQTAKQLLILDPQLTYSGKMYRFVAGEYDITHEHMSGWSSWSMTEEGIESAHENLAPLRGFNGDILEQESSGLNVPLLLDKYQKFVARLLNDEDYADQLEEYLSEDEVLAPYSDKVTVIRQKRIN